MSNDEIDELVVAKGIPAHGENGDTPLFHCYVELPRYQELVLSHPVERFLGSLYVAFRGYSIGHRRFVDSLKAHIRKAIGDVDNIAVVSLSAPASQIEDLRKLVAVFARDINEPEIQLSTEDGETCAVPAVQIPTESISVSCC
jgi:hypothetical protein